MSPEQQVAQNRMDEALADLFRCVDFLGEGEIVTSWALAAHVVRADTEDESRYVTAVAGGSMPAHMAIGLFRIGIDVTMNGEDE